MVDTGHGPPVVMIPGIQGRWEWMRPAVNALSTRCRVVTASLAGEPRGLLPAPRHGFSSHIAWVEALLDAARLERVALCGVSYGGLVALHFAARRPSRVSALVLVSTPPPNWTPHGEFARYVRMPRSLCPLFALSASRRLYPELARTFPALRERAGFAVRHLWRVLSAPCAPVRMAARVRLLDSVDLVADSHRIACPTLVVTGSANLDRTVPVSSTREYLGLIPGARHAEIPRTGHLGLITQPRVFRDVVSNFLAAHPRDDLDRRAPEVSAAVAAAPS